MAPPTPKAPEKDEFEERAELLQRTSSDARHATYKEVDPPDDVNPPPGRMVEQTRGEPKED